MSKREQDRDNYLIRLGVHNAPPATPIWGQRTFEPNIRTVTFQEGRLMMEDLVRVQPMTLPQGLVIERADVSPRRLRANWTMELAQDLRYVHQMEIDSNENLYIHPDDDGGTE